MLAMHYKIGLKDAQAVAAVRTRVKERGPVFDGLPGLAHKWFLIDPDDPCYATFYLWREPKDALAFLEGKLFQAVIQSFGRPRVHLLLPTSIDLPQSEPTQAWLGSSAAPPTIRTLDADDGTALNLSFARGPDRRFDVAYHARDGK